MSTLENYEVIRGNKSLFVQFLVMPQFLPTDRSLQSPIKIALKDQKNRKNSRDRHHQIQTSNLEAMILTPFKWLLKTRVLKLV